MNQPFILGYLGVLTALMFDFGLCVVFINKKHDEQANCLT